MTARSSIRFAPRFATLLALLFSGACQLDSLLNQESATTQPAPVATKLAFTTQPADARAGAILDVIEVTAQDDAGNVASGFTGEITLTLAGTADGRLLGGVSRTAVAGVARFTDLSVDLAGEDYVLTASAANLASATSEPFTIFPRPPARILSVSGDAQTDTAGATLAPYVVRVIDEEGAGVSGVTVSWAVAPNQGTIDPDTSVTDGAGQAAATHTLGTTAGVHTVTATVSGLAGSPVTFRSTAPPATPFNLAFVQQPTNAGVLDVITPAVVVAVQDRFDNIVTDHADPLQIAIAPGTGTPAARLHGTTSRAPTNGVTTFADLRIDLPGIGYRLRVTTGSLAATSTAFNVLRLGGSTQAQSSLSR